METTPNPHCQSTLEMRRVRNQVQETHRLLLAGLVHLLVLLHGTAYPPWLSAWHMVEAYGRR